MFNFTAYLYIIFFHRESVKKAASYIRAAIVVGMPLWVAKFGAANASDQELVDAIWLDMCESPNMYNSSKNNSLLEAINKVRLSQNLDKLTSENCPPFKNRISMVL